MYEFKKRNLKNTTIYVLPAIATLALIVVLSTTSPSDCGPIVLAGMFLLLYVVIITMLTAVFNMVVATYRLVKPQYINNNKRAYYILSVVAFVPVLLVALNTLGKLDIFEIALVLLLSMLCCFYISRRVSR